jgi:hypothetical protein
MHDSYLEPIQAAARQDCAQTVDLVLGTMFGADAVTCPQNGSCVAVGDSEWHSTTGPANDLEFRATTVPQANGTWRTSAIAVTLPTNARSLQRSGAGLLSVTCTSRSQCVAVGEYADTNNETQAMVVST